MALSVLLQGARKLPAFTNAASRLMASKFTNSNLVLTPIIARDFTGLSRTSILDSKRVTSNNLQVVQSRAISHSTIWAAEKILSAALLAIIPVCIAFPHPILDNVLAASLVLHMHWGVESVVVDYIRPVLFGSVIPKLAHWTVYIITAITLGCLMYFNFNDVGLAMAVRQIWAIGKEVEEDQPT